ncbi:RNAse THREE-like protein 3 [Arabidopsis thaliana]|uniref:RNAse THREE-like protein 3 n=1 Tax=Arabidopsis thaliana TaxID=3702 RepID=A0A1P8BB87_ARATH|nr:RNAse THREE-like protein 3 [Arabidopsis thaliana]NP_001330579.1 RNAse THREE-like protein 3 [Arabidopsis thaliana]ANM68860.1 RNAse THREE-like protein 3 [Arabidopsis thaliana]ANM68861.1 RNAse THREE-like protein 3 [Arabidopsis thaliana]|eukprot:NP_001330578.1 RNAse THREE-like protein 3 [Arabidopsis thaliana]
MPIEKIRNKDCLDVDLEDVKGKSFEICSTELFSLSTVSENSLTDEMSQEEVVIDEDSPNVEPEDVKGKLFEICYTRKLQIQTGSSGNPLTYEMTTKQMVVDKDSLHVEPVNGRGELIEICTKNKWPRPIFSVQEEKGPKNEPKFVCSVKIEIPNIEGTFHMKGDIKSKKKQAENSLAYHMIRALESSLVSLVISNLQKPKSLDEKNNPLLFSSEMDSSVEAVEKILNYSFVNKTLLKELLTHNNSPLFQGLMFVGESALSLAFTKHLYLTYPMLEPKDLSVLRDANTCHDKYACVAVKKGIYQSFIGSVPKPEKMTTDFIELMGKEDDPYRVVKAPKILVNLLAGVAGAVYIDVKYNVQRLLEIFRVLLEPIYTLDDLRMQLKQPFLMLFRLADKHGKQIDFRYSKDGGSRKNIAQVYMDDMFIASGCAKRIDTAKLLAAEEAIQKLSECMPIEKIIHQDNLDGEVIQTGSSSLLTAFENPLTEEMTQEQMVIDEDSLDVEWKLFETEELQIQTGSSSMSTVSENPLPCEITPTKMVIGEVSPHVELEDVKGKSFEISSTETSSLPIAFENPLTNELTQEQMVIDENSPYVEPVDTKGKLFESCSVESSSLPTTSENPSTYEMTTKQMVVDKDSPHVEPEDEKGKLFEICAKNKWPNPIFSVEEERGQQNEQKIVCSVKIEIPNIEGTFHIKGDAKPTKKEAENSSADHMIRALESSVMSLVITNLQMHENLDGKKKNLQMKESLNENKTLLHSTKRRRRL